MKYRNKNTGTILDINSELSGESWEVLTSQQTAEQAEENKEEKKPVKKKAKG